MKYLCLYILLSWYSCVMAQQDDIRTFYVGADMGWSVEDLSENKTTTGFTAQLFGEIPLPSRWAILLGVGTNQLGTQTTKLDVSASGQFQIDDPDVLPYRVGTYQYKYLSIPFKLKRYLGAMNAGAGITTYIFNPHLEQYGDEYEFIPENPMIFTYQQKDIRVINPAFTASIAYHFTLKDYWEFFIEAESNYFLSSIFIGDNKLAPTARFVLFGKIGIRKAVFGH